MTDETKILLCLAAGLVGLELAVRPAEPLLSKDLAHVATFDGIAGRFSAAPGGGGVLVLGNSLARCALDEGRLREGLGLAETDPLVWMVPDATGVAEWAWGYRRHVLHRGARPDRVLLVTGRTHLLDPAALEEERLGAFYVGGGGDRRRFFLEELGGAETRCSFLLAGLSRLYADRGRLRPRLFYGAMPGYEEAVNRINRAAGGGHEGGEDGGREGGEHETGEGLRQLALLVDSVRESGAELIVATAPLPGRWSLPEAVSDFLATQGVPVLPLGEGDPLPAERFPDGYHLDAEGAVEATDRLLEGLARLEAVSGGG